MTIECYLKECMHHGNNEGEEGPFCFMTKCVRNDNQLEILASLRDKFQGDNKFLCAVGAIDVGVTQIALHGDTIKSVMTGLMKNWPEKFPIHSLAMTPEFFQPKPKPGE